MFEGLLKAAAPMLQIFVDQVVIPELQTLEDKIGSEDLKMVCDTLLAAVKKIADAELQKI